MSNGSRLCILNKLEHCSARNKEDGTCSLKVVAPFATCRFAMCPAELSKEPESKKRTFKPNL